VVLRSTSCILHDAGVYKVVIYWWRF